MKKEEYYINKDSCSCSNSPYFLINNLFKELDTEKKKKIARLNLGINDDNIVDIENYMEIELKLPKGIYYYHNNPTISIVANLNSKVINPEILVDENKDYLVFKYYINNNTKNIYYACYLNNYFVKKWENNDTPLEIKQIFNDALATPTNNGLMSAEDKEKLDNLPDESIVYTKEEINILLSDKADNNNVYSKIETDNNFATKTELNEKANSYDVYTKKETNVILNTKANALEVYNRISDIEEIIGEGGSVDERIAIETNRAQAAEELLREAYESLSQSQVVPKTAEEWAAMTSWEEGVIYRVAGTTSYTDYMYNGTTTIAMATYNNAIDEEPVAGSNNLVKSGGVVSLISSFADSNLVDKTKLTRGKYLSVTVAGYGPNQSFKLGSVTDYIPISAGQSITSYPLLINSAVGYQLYNEQKEWISSAAQSTDTITIPSDAINVSYIRITLAVNETEDITDLPIRAYYGTTLLPYTKYGVFEKIKESAIPNSFVESLNEANQTAENANQTAENANQTAENANQTAENANQTAKETETLITGLKQNFIKDYIYYSGTDAPKNVAGWCLFENYIPISPGDTYEWCPNDRGSVAVLIFYDENYTVLSHITASSAVVTGELSIQSSARYVRACFSMNDMTAIYLKINENIVWKPAFNKVGIVENVFPNITNAFRYSNTINNGETLSGAKISIKKDISMLCIIDGNISDIDMGFNTLYIKLTPTNISRHYNNRVVTEEHGLQLGQHTTLLLIRNNDDNAKVCITNDNGETYSTILDFPHYGGNPIVRNNGTNALQVTFLNTVNDVDKNIWIFGDSYLSMTSAQRWSYVLRNFGFSNWLLNNHDGASSSHALTALENLISLGKNPIFIVWCMGMNKGGDTPEGDVNPTWLSDTSSMLTMCEEHNITPILMTIPTCPSTSTSTESTGNRKHIALNTWIKASDYRYIDAAGAVEQEGTETWKGWGTSEAMLSSDKVHPTENGAMAICLQVLKDFPEIMIMEN